MIDLTDLAYTAGIVDGDGCVQIMKRKSDGNNCYAVRLSVSMTSDQIPNWLSVTYGGKVYKFLSSKTRQQPIYRWAVEAIKAKEVLTIILPYLKDKFERAKLAIKLQESMQPRGYAKHLDEKTILLRDGLHQQMRDLNSKHSRAYWTKSGVN